MNVNDLLRKTIIEANAKVYADFYQPLPFFKNKRPAVETEADD